MKWKNILNTKAKLGKKVNRILITLNLIFIAMLVAEYFTQNSWIKWLEIALTIVFAAELILRFKFSTKKQQKRFFLNPLNIIDIIVITIVVAKAFFGGSFILQLLSSLRILRSYRALSELSKEHPKIYYSYEILKSILNLMVFIVIMSGLVLLLQGPKNDQINTMVDALYFTITSLTTTGYGDIIATGPDGKILIIFIMIFGVALFLKLATNIFRPSKRFFKCTQCGLFRHDPDAIHCKHCGHTVNISNEGE